ncbi:MAG TPA: hypothetical protein V6D14_30990 [Coleofasciculaceae cyanobacterium]|jgi:hypothetical protein
MPYAQRTFDGAGAGNSFPGKEAPHKVLTSKGAALAIAMSLSYHREIPFSKALLS